MEKRTNEQIERELCRKLDRLYDLLSAMTPQQHRELKALLVRANQHLRGLKV